jgi:hypothetical protein
LPLWAISLGEGGRHVWLLFSPRSRYCEELHAALDQISKVLRIPYMSKLEIRRRIAQIIVKVRKPD